MQVGEICDILRVKPAQQVSNDPIKALVYDSRRVTGDHELFIALQGTHHNGHDYIEKVYKQGVRNFLIEEDVNCAVLKEGNFIRVENCLKSLQKIASAQRSKYQCPVIGITGSNGKTIIKEWLATLLGEDYRVVKSPKSYNSQLGVPLSVWEMSENHEVAVFEAGVSKKGEMSALQKVIQPTIGIFTNIGDAHSEGFSSLKEKLKEKAELFDDTSINICRLSHKPVMDVLSAKKGKLITWEINDEEALINIIPKNRNYTFEYGGNKHSFNIDLTNPYDLENIFHGIVCAILLEVSQKSIQRGLDKIRAVPMRLELKRGLNDCYILDDSYNNDLLGLGIALNYLKQQPTKQQTVVVLSDILQAGKPDAELYSAVNQLLISHDVELLIGIGHKISLAKDQFSMRLNCFESTDDFIKTAPQFSNQAILVKGARDFRLERVVGYLEEKNHGTVLEVNYESLLHNLSLFRERLNPKTKLMVMVKAFAYGVGVDEIAHLLQYHQVDYLGVAYLDEAINLRRKGIKLPIMIMNVDWESFKLVETFSLEPEIYSLPMIHRYLADCDNPPPVHLKIETGMNRLGFGDEDMEELLDLLHSNPHLKVAGIFSHLSSAEDAHEDEFTKAQAQKFENSFTKIAEVLGYQPIKHIVNSAGIVRWPDLHFDMVRLGIGLYGFDSSQELDGLKPISTLKTKISQIKSVKETDTVGYNRKGKISGSGLVATVAIGYADGYSRAFGNGKAYMLLNGQKAYTVGNICMDMTMLDVSHLKVTEGDEVIVFGENPPIHQLAEWADTIPYEILTNVSQRVKRVFVSE